jgi:hypothetical protein
MIDSDGLDPTTEKRMLLLQSIQRSVQPLDNCLGLIGDDGQFDIDLFVYHLHISSLYFYAYLPPNHILSRSHARDRKVSQ